MLVFPRLPTADYIQNVKDPRRGTQLISWEIPRLRRGGSSPNMGKARAQKVPNLSIQSGKKETGALGIVFMEIRVVIDLAREEGVVGAIPANGFRPCRHL